MADLKLNMPINKFALFDRERKCDLITELLKVEN